MNVTTPREVGGPDADQRVGAGPLPILELREVHFSYPNGLRVLDGISLAVPAGEIVGIVGPSGCGKSTLLALIAGLARPSFGSIERRFDKSGRHPLSMVFQKDTLLPWLTAAENVRFFARFKKHGYKHRLFPPARPKRSTRKLDARVMELLEMGHLADHAKAYPYQLSGGMRRRLAFLAGVAVDPQLLLLDEPFSSVDEPTRVGIHQDVFHIARKMKMTMFLVTHDLAEAITLCDRVLILTNRPARTVRQDAIPFGDERQMLELRKSETFLELYGGLWNELSRQIAASGADASADTHGS